MKESYVEGLATHNGPESCVATREGGDEALTGERAGRVFSRVTQLRDADIARRLGVPRGQRPRARSEAPRTGTGRSPVHPKSSGLRIASGSLRTHADDERAGEVGQTRST